MAEKKASVGRKRPSWDEYFLEIAELVGSRGTCDRGRAGTVVTRDKRILTTGYVGAPVGVKDCDEVGHELHTVINTDSSRTQHCIRTTHSEQNAIVQGARVGVSLLGGTMYTHMTPCYTCAKIIINAGIVRVVAKKDYHAAAQSKEVFKAAGVAFELVTDETESYPNMKADDDI